MKRSGERILHGVVLILAGMVIVVQLFLARPDTRSVFVGLERREGVGLSPQKRTAQICMEALRPEPGVFVLVNGKKVKNFYNKKITISVQEFGVITLSAIGVNHPVSVEITGISDYVKRENLTMRVRGENEKFLIGQILFQ